MIVPSERDCELAAYWTERGDLRAWLSNIIAAVRAEGRRELHEIITDAMVEAAAQAWRKECAGRPDAGTHLSASLRAAVAAAQEARLKELSE